MIGFMDVETLKLHTEVGGWHRAKDMGFALGCLYINEQRGYQLYLGKDPNRKGPGCYEGVDDTEDFINDLKSVDLLVGFNIKRFDYAVLQPYASQYDIQLNTLPTFDILEQLGRSVGRPYPASLESLATINLGRHGQKTEDPKAVVSMYRSGLIDEVLLYCLHDVWTTRMLFQVAYQSGELQLRNKRGTYYSVDVTPWRDEVYRLLGAPITDW